MSVYGGIGSQINITNNTTASAPCTLTILSTTNPNQSGVEWDILLNGTKSLPANLVIAPGQSTMISYYVQFSESASGDNVTPFVFNCEVSCVVNGTPTTIQGWMEIYTDPCGYVERPDNVYLSLSFNGVPAQVSSQSQPDGQSNPDPFAVSMTVQGASVAQGTADGIVLTCAQAVVEKILEGLIGI